MSLSAHIQHILDFLSVIEQKKKKEKTKKTARDREKVLLSNSLIQIIRNWYTCWNLKDISGSLPVTRAKERKQPMSKMEQETSAGKPLLRSV